MTNPTSNFGWQMPTASDLVTDLPADFETFGQAVDTSLADLKGGTTGQILSKASNTDMDFTWVTNDVGDITAVTAGTGITGGGTSGAVTVSFDQANFGGGQFAAGKNKIINGDFRVWQRGTSITPATGYGFTADRWRTYSWGSSTSTVTQQTFTPGTAPVAGYEGQYFLRVNSTNTNTFIGQQIEDVRTLAGQTVTVSFWAKAASSISGTANIAFDQNFGSGGSSTVNTSFSAGTSFTTSWARYSYTGTLPSVSGKTIGSSSFIDLTIALGVVNNNFDIWGVQVEAGSTATPFQTASGSIGGELALCQRYYQRITASNAYGFMGTAIGFNSTTAYGIFYPKVNLRDAIAIEYSNLALIQSGGALAVTSLTIQTTYTSNGLVGLQIGIASGGTADRAYGLQANNTGSAYLAISGEL